MGFFILLQYFKLNQLSIMTNSVLSSIMLISLIVFPSFKNLDLPQIHVKNADWIWLFNGKDTDAWKGVHSDEFPEKG